MEQLLLSHQQCDLTLPANAGGFDAGHVEVAHRAMTPKTTVQIFEMVGSCFMIFDHFQ